MTSTEGSLLIKIINSITSSEEEIEKPSPEPKFITDPKSYKESLQTRLKAFGNHALLKEGDIVVWKPGLKNKRLPDINQPAIVVKIIDPPTINKEDSYYENFDIVLGFVTEDDEFLTFSYDSKRFDHAT